MVVNLGEVQLFVRPGTQGRRERLLGVCHGQLSGLHLFEQGYQGVGVHYSRTDRPVTVTGILIYLAIWREIVAWLG